MSEPSDTLSLLSCHPDPALNLQTGHVPCCRSDAISMKLPEKQAKLWKYMKNKNIKFDQVRKILVTRLRAKKLQHARKLHLS